METQNEIKKVLCFWKLGVMDIFLKNGNTITFPIPKEKKTISFIYEKEMFLLSHNLD